MMTGMAEEIETAYGKRDREAPKIEIPSLQNINIGKYQGQYRKEYQDTAGIDVPDVFADETIVR